MRASLGVTAIALLAACDDGTAPRTGLPEDPGDARFVTSDIENFWRAYDAGGDGASADAFQRDYLSRASEGLREFAAARNVTAAMADRPPPTSASI